MVEQAEQALQVRSEQESKVAYELILADHHALFRAGLKEILNESPDLRVVGEASDNSGLLNLLTRLTPHMVLLDLSLPNLQLIKSVSEIRRIHADIKILIMAMDRIEEYVSETFAAGADGYLLKDEANEELMFAIESILKGSKYVPPFLRPVIA